MVQVWLISASSDHRNQLRGENIPQASPVEDFLGICSGTTENRLLLSVGSAHLTGCRLSTVNGHLIVL